MTTILCPKGHRHGVPESLADCWVYDGEPRDVPVTMREFDVVTQLLRTGAGNREIGQRLFITEDTVKCHIKALYRRTGAKTRAELMSAVFRGRVRLFPVEKASALMWSATDAPLIK